jgi:tetratricopeptide (TPR) repeat protein
MREALRLLDDALEIVTFERYPEDFALAQSRKGNLLLDMGSTVDLLDRSLSAFEAALTIYSQECYREDRALVLSNMATAYLTRGGNDDLRKAVAMMEQALAVRTRRAQPYEWALTQMNMGLALSRLPASDKTYVSALEALRGAYDVFRELRDPAQASAAYNLGIALTRSGDAAYAEEACDRLEECLPRLIEANQQRQAADAIDSLFEAYLLCLDHENDLESADAICQRALALFQNYPDNKSGMKAAYDIGNWLLRHSQKRSHRLALAGVAFERVLAGTRASEYIEVRAATLANFATVLLLQELGPRELNRIRARDCMDEALRLLRSLPQTPQREEQMGLILMNRARSGLGTGFS